MTDTQWPRFEVFQQDRSGRPHKNVGTVHAPDAELALQNARDVFTRRPSCLSLWVVPAESIFAKTRQELRNDSSPHVTQEVASPRQLYYVFQKQSQRQSMSFVEHTGEVRAANPYQALSAAVEKYGALETTYVWWVCPEKAIVRSSDDEIESMFSPANEKLYRNPSEYRVMSEMMQVKSALRKGGPD
jgi:ring-1,2-phenylacetyl-CoA epoxidase subunit PaaB